MSELKEVPQKTPVLDAVEGTGKFGRIVALVLRPLKRWQEARARRKAQEYIDRTWHGKPDREDTP